MASTLLLVSPYATHISVSSDCQKPKHEHICSKNVPSVNEMIKEYNVCV